MAGDVEKRVSEAFEAACGSLLCLAVVESGR